MRPYDSPTIIPNSYIIKTYVQIMINIVEYNLQINIFNNEIYIYIYINYQKLYHLISNESHPSPTNRVLNNVYIYII